MHLLSPIPPRTDRTVRPLFVDCIVILVFLLLPLFLPFGATAIAGGPRATVKENEYDFGSVRRGASVIHVFTIKNEGTEDLVIENVELMERFTTVRVLKAIPPGREGKITVTFETARFAGEFRTGVILSTNDPENPRIVFVMKGRVSDPIDVLPYSAVFLTSFQGETAERSLSIVNNDVEPLLIKEVQSEGKSFHAELQSIRENMEYRLSVRSNPDAAPGKYKEILWLSTNNEKIPRLKVVVNNYIKNEVYVFPEEIDLGTIRLEDLEKVAGMERVLSQTVLVKHREAKDFKIQVEHDLPFIKVSQTPASGSDTYRLDIVPRKEKLTKGKIGGVIRVQTNDEDVPELTIPVVGEIL
jgi:hypothetical protein